MTGIFSGYVNSMLTEYAKNPGVNWKHKDAAIYLVTSLASKAQTQKVRCVLGPAIDGVLIKQFYLFFYSQSSLHFHLNFPSSVAGVHNSISVLLVAHLVQTVFL